MLPLFRRDHTDAWHRDALYGHPCSRALLVRHLWTACSLLMFDTVYLNFLSKSQLPGGPWELHHSVHQLIFVFQACNISGRLFGQAQYILFQIHSQSCPCTLEGPSLSRMILVLPASLQNNRQQRRTPVRHSSEKCWSIVPTPRHIYLWFVLQQAASQPTDDDRIHVKLRWMSRSTTAQ